MIAAFTPHRRQFFIGPDERPPVMGWSTRELPAGRYLHHCPSLPMVDAGGRLVVGLALRGGRDEPRTWGGRYLTIEGRSLTTDTGSLLGVYTTSGAQGPVFSSSPAVMAAHSGAPRVARRLAWYSLNWHPLPGSGRVETTKVLPATTVDLVTGEQRLAPSPAPLAGSIDDRADVLAATLGGQLGDLSDRPTVWVALTAGLDSRTVLAAALHSGCRVRTFTQRFPSLSAAELAVARAVATAADVDHQVIELGRSDRAVRRDIGRHSDDETVDADRYALARHGLGFAGPGEPILRGGVFEYGRRFFADIMDHLSWADVCADPGAVIDRVRMGPRAAAAFREGMVEWVRCRGTDADDVHWMDRFYLDQRVAGWLAGIEQLLDGAVDASLHPANSAPALSAVIAARDEEPVGEQVQRRVIERLAPQLMAPPINPVDGTSRVAAVQQRTRIVSRMISSEVSSLVASAR